MIQITLSFKSATFASQALREIPESWLVGAETPEVVEQPAKKPAGKRTTAETATAPALGQLTAEVAAETAAPVKTAAEPTPTAPSAEEKQPASTAVEYPVLQKAVFALAGKSRDAAAAVAASFGVKTFKDLDAARWGEALAAVNAKIAEL